MNGKSNGNGRHPQLEPNIGDHARLTHVQVAAAGEPQNPIPEDPPAIIHAGKRDMRVTVFPDPEDGDATPREEHVYLIRSDIALPDEAYRKVSEKKCLGRPWGRMVFALVLKRVGEGVAFQEPRQSEAEYVAIKELDKLLVKSYLRRGGKENPYRDIQRMQQIGDNLHVLKCVGALKDDRNIYTIMPRCEGSLLDAIPWSSLHERNEGWISEAHASLLFRQVFSNLHYLQKHGICHHDLSPDNMMIYNGRLLFIDFAMSLRVPHSADSDSRLLVTAQGNFGKEPHSAPEIVANAPFDGYAIDLWAAATTLYNLVAADYLFYKAKPIDVLFQYFIMAGGLSNMPLNERTVEILMDEASNIHGRGLLMTRAMAHLNLSWDVMDLLHNMLQLDPTKRFTLAQCVESKWIQGGLDQATEN